MPAHATATDKEVDRFFISIASYGRADAKGKTIIGIEMSKKRALAPPDAPLSLVVALLEQLVPSMSYSSPEAFTKDVARLKNFANGLELK